VYKIDGAFLEYWLVSVSFQIIPAPLGRLGLGPGPHVVGQLGSRIRVSASFKIFALTAGGNVLGLEGNCPAGNVRGEYVVGGK